LHEINTSDEIVHNAADIVSKEKERSVGVNQTKEAQRAELHRTIWKIANDLRGSVDGWENVRSETSIVQPGKTQSAQNATDLNGRTDSPELDRY